MIPQTLVGLSIGALVFGLAFAALALGTRSESAGQVLEAVRGASVLQLALYEDLRQAVVPPGAADPLRVAPHALSFYRVALEPQTVRLLPAHWYATAKPDGTLRLHRRVTAPGGDQQRTSFAVPLRTLAFRRVPAGTRTVLRAEFAVGAESTTWTLTVPLPRPIGLDDATLDTLLDLGVIAPLPALP